MPMPTLTQWKSDTSRWWAKRSTALKAVDDALDTFNHSTSDDDLLALAAALKGWMQSKNDWSQSTRNTGANADVVTNLVEEVRKQSLKVGFQKVKTQLLGQIQGTCGIYSVYNAVAIFRALNKGNPTILPPKKSYGGGAATDSLREYSKRQFLSGQGELLYCSEMERLVSSQGYTTDSFDYVTKGNDLAAKKRFIESSLKAGCPVLIAYLADEDKTGIIYTTTVKTGVGAHWSLIVGADGNFAFVVEPNAPTDYKLWTLNDLLSSNAASDSQKFVRYWAKLVHPGVSAGIKDIGEDDTGWVPFRAVTGKSYGQKKLYDLSGSSGKRHLRQNLNNVLVAIQPRLTVVD